VRTVGVRDYRPADSFRHVHWKASARRQNLQVRVFEPTTAYTMILVLNVATFTWHWEGTRPELMERAVCATASIANYAVERRWLVGLAANGAMPNADQPIRVPPGRGPDQLSFSIPPTRGRTVVNSLGVEKAAASLNELLEGLGDLAPTGPGETVKAPPALGVIRPLLIVGLVVGLGVLVIRTIRRQSWPEREREELERIQAYWERIKASARTNKT
jgi:hypothetical protein